MPAVKIEKFLGLAPKAASQLLPSSAAQEANNVKLYSGDLIPYRLPKEVGSTGRSGAIKTIYPMKDPATDAITWLSWANDVDIAISTSLNTDEQRIYYTGDGVPKVTTYEKALTGSAPYPNGYFELGLPLPTAKPVATATSFSALTVQSYARDSGSIATLTFASAHGLKSGAVVTVSGFNDTSPDTTPFNLTNTVITVTSSTAFTYYNVGSAVTTATTDVDGRVNLAGNTIQRNYVYTWYTPWGEESIPSEPSADIFCKEGQVVTVSSLPNSPPAGTNYVRGIRLYRTVTTTAGSDYLRLRTIWFPRTITSASRTTNVATLTFSEPHMVEVGDYIKVSSVAFGGVADTSFNGTDLVVTAVSTDGKSLSYASTGTTKATTACSAGTLAYDVAEPGRTTHTYYESTSFTDDYDVYALVFPLVSLDYDPPDAGMTGLIRAHNNILVGFVGNELCFSEPGKPWAWPIIYRQIFESPIVAIAAVSETILVMTEKYPFVVLGNEPANMGQTRIDAPYPCTSKRGVVNMGYGAIYPTHGGLAIWGGAAGLDIITKVVHDWDTWELNTDASELIGEFFSDKYFGSYTTGSIIFQQDSETGGNLTTSSATFTSAFYDAVDDAFYYVKDNTGTVYQWDAVGQPLADMSWKSKVIDTPLFINIGAARVVADYTVDEEGVLAVTEYNAQVAANNLIVWGYLTAGGQPIALNPVNGPHNYIDPATGAQVWVSGSLNTTLVNGDLLTSYPLPLPEGSNPITFSIWVDKELLVSTTLLNNDVFRLPTGYRYDRFEVGVSGAARVQAIHLGETPTQLRTS
jgi:hypothetical protein